MPLAAYRIIPAIGRIFSAIVAIQSSFKNIEPLFVLKNSHPTNFLEIPKLAFEKEISLKNVSFAYEKEYKILRNISFQVNRGETIGFIGVSGSGKTTLMYVLLRFIQEQQGHIFIDGKQLSKENNAAFQKNIGYVQQEIFIKDGTLLENIAFGETDEQVNIPLLKETIEQSMLADFVEYHPLGYNMLLGEDGVKLSGGQKQRVGIARALYRQADILIFDEATSALDMETERAIVKTIDRLTHTNKTIFIVAHRITTLSNCDRIYELKNGQIGNILKYEKLLSEKMNTSYS